MNIAAYRDGSNCADTIVRAFNYSADPGRLRFYVLDQTFSGDSTCSVEFIPRIHRLCLGSQRDCAFYKQRVFFSHIDAKEAGGPIAARSLVQRLMWGPKSKDSDDWQDTVPKPEDMCLNIDAHHYFIRDWDRLLLDQYLLQDNEMAVLTTYPYAHTHKYVPEGRTF